MHNAPRVNMGISGHFHLVLRKASGEVKQELEFDNLITDNGLRAIITDSLGTFNAHVGTGTATPTFSDVKLANPLAQTSLGSGAGPVSYRSRTEPPFWTQMSIKRTFPPGVGTGVLTEIGMAPSANLDLVHTRTLIKDANGNPTSITKLADDFLDVTYTIRTAIPNVDVPFSFNLNGQTVTGFIRPLGLSDTLNVKWQPAISLPTFITSAGAMTPYTGALPVIHGSGNPTGLLLGPSEITTVNDTVNLRRRYTCTWNPDRGNMDIKSLMTYVGHGSERCRYGIQFDTPIMKTASQRFRFMFDIGVARG